MIFILFSKAAFQELTASSRSQHQDRTRGCEAPPSHQAGSTWVVVVMLPAACRVCIPNPTAILGSLPLGEEKHMWIRRWHNTGSHCAAASAKQWCNASEHAGRADVGEKKKKKEIITGLIMTGFNSDWSPLPRSKIHMTSNWKVHFWASAAFIAIELGDLNQHPSRFAFIHFFLQQWGHYFICTNISAWRLSWRW